MEDIEDNLEDEELEDDDEPREVDVGDEPAAAPAAAGDGDVGSIEDLLVKKEAQAEEEEDDDDDSMLSLTREERLEPLAVKVVPPQPTEFICKNCYLVKHRSQLKDKNRMLCRDCA
jgi:hypothetical protein